MSRSTETMKALAFGTELEYENISREAAVRAIQSVIGGYIGHEGGSYDTWTVTAPDGRVWKAVRDASLSNPATTAEVVTPILKWADIPTVQKVVRVLKRAGASAALTSTSQHVHIGVNDWSAKQIANFARIWYKQEVLILKALGTLPRRLERYTRPTDREFIRRLEETKPETRDQLNMAWFGTYTPNPAHYNTARYRAINLNNVWRTGTVEIRAFNGTTHAGEVRAHIVLSLAIAAKAFTAKCATTKTPRVYDPETAKYDFRVFLLHLGLIGDEFKTTRKHLLKHLTGCTAWKHVPPRDDSED